MQTDPLDGFDFRADGFFLDAFGAPCVLLGTVEFTDFWNAFDACFSSPMGRKLIYAATDAKKTSCGAHNRLNLASGSAVDVQHRCLQHVQ